MKTKNNFFTIFLISIILAIILSGLFAIGIFSNINTKLTDNLYGGKNALTEIVIVAIDDKSLQAIGRWPWDRTVYSELLPKLSSAKIVGLDVTFFEESNNESDTAFSKTLNDVDVILPMEYTSFTRDSNDAILGSELLLPIPLLLKNAAGLGYVNIMTDSDGISRAVNVKLSSEYNSFVLEIYQQATDNSYLFRDNRFLVNFANKPGTFTRYSASDVINGNIDSSAFEDKIVFIGATAPDLHDDYFVPTSQGQAMPGVEIHANTLQTMLTNSKLEKLSTGANVFLIFLTVLLFSFIVHELKVWISASLSLAWVLLYLFLAIKMFNQGQIFNLIYVPLSTVLTYFTIISYSYFFEEREKRKVMNAFSKYVSADVINDIMKNPEKLKLGGERANITIFFSDIRGFTSISEILSPEQLVSLLNDYLTEMTNIIMENGGVVDKYMGDAIMAFWGAPVKHKNHAKMAAKATMQMEVRLKELQKKWANQGIPILSIGIGLNTGHAVIGNMGSKNRFDYTAMGDTINLGSRLEGLNKSYNTTAIVSESTFREITDEFFCRRLDKVQVKGKKKPIIIYELIDFSNKVGDDVKKAVKHFEKGLQLYFDKKFNPAIKEFEKAVLINHDKPSQIFIKRCKVFKKSPPSANWTGVWVMKTK